MKLTRHIDSVVQPGHGYGHTITIDISKLDPEVIREYAKSALDVDKMFRAEIRYRKWTDRLNRAADTD